MFDKFIDWAGATAARRWVIAIAFSLLATFGLLAFWATYVWPEIQAFSRVVAGG